VNVNEQLLAVAESALAHMQYEGTPGQQELRQAIRAAKAAQHGLLPERIEAYCDGLDALRESLPNTPGTEYPDIRVLLASATGLLAQAIGLAEAQDERDRPGMRRDEAADAERERRAEALRQ
jgi:hypothetical protein